MPLDRPGIRARDDDLQAVRARGEIELPQVRANVRDLLGDKFDRRTCFGAVDEDLHDAVVDGLGELGLDAISSRLRDGECEGELVTWNAVDPPELPAAAPAEIAYGLDLDLSARSLQDFQRLALDRPEPRSSRRAP